MSRVAITMGNQITEMGSATTECISNVAFVTEQRVGVAKVELLEHSITCTYNTR